jgi:phage terminase large subunit-like protein
LANGGIGIEVFAAEAKTGDGVIPFPFAIVDELHRHDDLGFIRCGRASCVSAAARS